MYSYTIIVTCIIILATAQPLHTPTLQQPMSMEVKGATVTTDGGELPSAYSKSTRDTVTDAPVIRF